MFIDRIKKFFNGANISESKPAPPAAMSANGFPDLGDALLSPGLLARKAEANNPLPAVSAPEPVIVRPTLESTSIAVPVAEPPPVSVVVLDTDYDNIQLPPRSPEMIAALIAAVETVEARALRMHSDIARFRRQRGL
jgi:hypothetical protein